jgi:hypothetical protein
MLSSKPQSITVADLAYLRALNTVGQEVDYFMQKADIEAKMKKHSSGFSMESITVTRSFPPALVLQTVT